MTGITLTLSGLGALTLNLGGIGQGGWSKSVTVPYDCLNMDETAAATAGTKCSWGDVRVKAR
jgi:hypothetical protein